MQLIVTFPTRGFSFHLQALRCPYISHFLLCVHGGVCIPFSPLINPSLFSGHSHFCGFWGVPSTPYLVQPQQPHVTKRSLNPLLSLSVFLLLNNSLSMGKLSFLNSQSIFIE